MEIPEEPRDLILFFCASKTEEDNQVYLNFQIHVILFIRPSNFLLLFWVFLVLFRILDSNILIGVLNPVRDEFLGRRGGEGG